MTRKTAESHRAFERAQKLFPGGVNSPVRAFRSVGSEPFVTSHGEGAYLYDLDGNKYVDYINSWGPLVLGHAHPKVVAAITEQAARGTSFGTCSALESELAELVMQLVPSLEMIRFVNSGTEAGMAVVRLARGFTEKPKVIKFSGCYHGHADSFLVQAGSGVATLGLPDSPGVSSSVAKDTLTAQFNNIESVAALLKEHAGSVAAVIIEPVVGNAGFIPPQADFLKELRALTESQGVLLIFDEVMTGFRVALSGAQSVFGVKPDLTMLGKVIGGGLPVGAFGGRKDIMQMLAPIGPVYQAGTLSGNPLAMAAGLATLREWSAPGVFERVAATTTRLVQTMRDLAAAQKVPFIADSLGTMFGYFFHQGPVRSYEEAKGANLDRFKKFFHSMLDNGVYLAPSQFEAGFVSVMHDDEAIKRTVKALEVSFAD